MKTIKVKSLMWGWTAISTLMIIVMVASLFATNMAVQNEREAAETGRTALISAAQLQKGSDTLTYSVWWLAATGNGEFASDYLYEKDVSKTRENALSRLHEIGLSGEVLAPAENAKKVSDELMQDEMYSIRLIYEGTRLTPMPDEVAAVQLTPEDVALPREQKMAKAKEYLFGSEYQYMKQEISESISDFYHRLETEITQKTKEASDALDLARKVQLISQLSLFVWLLALLLVAYRSMSRLLLLYIESIETSANSKEKRDLPLSGLYETRRLAQAYNALLREIRENEQRLHQQNEDLRRMSETDFLTGAYSRLALETRLTETLENDTGFCFSLVMLDIDHFKAFNDLYGHPMGDEALKTTADILRRTAEEYQGMAARIGGEEFMVMLPNTDGDGMRQYAEHAIQKIREADIPLDSGENLHISGSMGGYTHCGCAESLKDIYRKADKALYYAKTTGRAKYVAYDEMNAALGKEKDSGAAS